MQDSPGLDADCPHPESHGQVHLSFLWAEGFRGSTVGFHPQQATKPDEDMVIEDAHSDNDSKDAREADEDSMSGVTDL